MLVKCCCCDLDTSDPFTRVLIASQLQAFVSGGFIQFGLVASTFLAVKEEFELTYTQLTASLICYQVAVMFVSFISPMFQNHFQKTPLETISGLGCVVTVIGTVLYAVAQNYWMLLIGQVLNGAGSAAVLVFAPSMFSFLSSRRTKIADGIGKTTMLTPIGMILAFVIVGVAGAKYWRWWYGLGAVMMVVPTAAFLWIGYGYREFDPRKEDRTVPGNIEVLKAVVAKPKIVLTILGVSMAAFVVAAYAPYLPGYIQDHLHHSESTAAFFMASTIPFITISIGLGGFLADKRRWTPVNVLQFGIATALFAFVVIILVFTLDIRNFWLFAILVVIAMFTLFIVSAPALGCVAMMLPKHLISHGQASMGICTRALGAVCGPLLMGLLLDNGMAQNWAFFIAGCSAALGCMFFGFAICAIRWSNPEETGSPHEPASPQFSPPGAAQRSAFEGGAVVVAAGTESSANEPTTAPSAHSATAPPSPTASDATTSAGNKSAPKTVSGALSDGSASTTDETAVKVDVIEAEPIE